MKILAFDTSTEWCSAALYVDGDIRLREVHAGQKHSELLVPMLTELLAEAGLALGQVDALGYGKGPGSFTGLRIACGVAQGLAFGADLPVVGVVTLEALALEAGAERVVACLDARMNEVYAAIYRKVGEGLVAESAPGLYAPAAAPLPAGEGYVGCGSGFIGYPEALAERYAGRLAATRPECFPHARSVALLAAAAFARGEAGPAESAEPLYVRDKVALKTSERQGTPQGTPQ